MGSRARATAIDELSRSVIELVLSEPFLGHFLAGIPRRVSDVTPTAAVRLAAGRTSLVVNEHFFLEHLNKKERIAVVKHEALHLLFRHLFRLEGRHPLLFNLAADLVVNQYIKPWPLPEGAVVLATFPDLGLLPDQSADWYYDKLKKCGDESPISMAALQAIAAGGGWSDDHSGWGEASELDRQIAESELGRWVQQVKDRNRGYGKLPAPIGQLVDAWLEERKPKVDWRRVIRMFGASSRRSRLHDTLKRPSRRYGTIPGHRIKRFAKLAVAVDTSGSVGDSDLSDFFAEIRGLWRQGCEVTVIFCDAAVQGVMPYRGVTPAKVPGRGGTAFEPVFVWMNEQRERFDGCIYLTDGEGPAPTTDPGCPMLWVISRAGRATAGLRGRQIRIRD